MPTLRDLLHVAFSALALPLWGAYVSWPRFERQAQAHPAHARKQLRINAMLWPAIVLHALVDLGGGVLAWLVLREEAVVPA